MVRRVAFGLWVGALLTSSAPGAIGQEAGAPGGPGLALRARKALTAALEGEQVVDNAVLLVKDGRIEALGSARTTEVPAGYEVRDVGDNWLMPGMIDLHCHVAGTFDINDTVYLINPELRVHGSIIPHNGMFKRALAGGVTSVLYIPGSGSNSGGQGVLLKTGLDNYEEALIRNPGSLKVAQWGNPERWCIGVGKTFENYSLRNMFQRGLAYARAWEAHERGAGPEPERNIQWDLFRDLLAGETQVSTHTQVYQVVMETVLMIKGEFGIDVFIDHGSIGGWRAGALAEEYGVPAILGPRQVDWPNAGLIRWVGEAPERTQGSAAGYQSLGHQQIGFNTDAPVIPQEELFLQAGTAVRYGLDDEHLASVRGLTIIPAKTAGIDHLIGSLEAGKEADVLVISGAPGDPRSSVEAVLIEGHLVYDTERDPRRF
jgi:hypothetical protein